MSGGKETKLWLGGGRSLNEGKGRACISGFIQQIGGFTRYEKYHSQLNASGFVKAQTDTGIYHSITSTYLVLLLSWYLFLEDSTVNLTTCFLFLSTMIV
jgi:hypothetical protein